MKKDTILVYSEKNSARSQMFEAWLRYYLKDKIEVISAGTNPAEVIMLAQKAMMEALLDITKQSSKNISEVSESNFDHLIIVDGSKPETIGKNISYKTLTNYNVNDPSKAEGSDMDKLKVYRDVCNTIEDLTIEFGIKYYNLFD